jgi:hypothetical protein
VYFNDRFFVGQLPRSLAILLERRPVSAQSLLGYHCSRTWQRREGQTLSQIGISTLAIGDGADAALAVLLHEMVHLRNSMFGIGDCHPITQYNSRNFRDIAVLAGLECAVRHRSLGYADTALDDEGLMACRELATDSTLFSWRVT